MIVVTERGYKNIFSWDIDVNIENYCLFLQLEFSNSSSLIIPFKLILVFFHTTLGIGGCELNLK